MFGSPETTPGGRALKFYSSCRVDVRRISQLKEGDNIIGMRMKIKVVKNKVAPPFRQTEVDMLGSRGISLEADLIDLGLVYNLITRSGTWLSYGDTKLGQGRDKARAFLEENQEIVAELREKVMAAYVASGQTMPKMSD